MARSYDNDEAMFTSALVIHYKEGEVFREHKSTRNIMNITNAKIKINHGADFSNRDQLDLPYTAKTHCS